MSIELVVAIGAIIVAIISVPAALYIEYNTGFFAARVGRKELSYEILSTTPLASVVKDYRSKIEIFYDGVLVKDASLLVLKISNTGKKEIDKKDFDVALTVLFDEGVRIIETTNSESSHARLENKWTISNDPPKAKLEKMLVNKEDYLTTGFLLDGDTNKVDITCRLVGGTLKKIKHEPKINSPLAAITMLSMPAIVILLYRVVPYWPFIIIVSSVIFISIFITYKLLRMVY